MSPTYNWTYKSGAVINVLGGFGGGFTVAASADNIRPSSCAYVALFGSDITGNGSRQLPYRTIAKGVAVANIVIIGSGTYRESISSGYPTLIGDGDVVMDGTGFNVLSSVGIAIKNITVKNYMVMATSYVLAESCIFMDMQGDGNVGSALYGSCIFIRITTLLGINRHALQVTQNNTYVDCYDIRVQNTDAMQFAQWNHIFYQCNIAFTTASFISYSLLYNCNARFNASYTAPAVKYPSVPTGYTQITSLSALQAAHTAGYGAGVITNFTGCATADPLFNNYIINDFTLQFASPAKNLSYKGTFVGAHSIAQAIKVRATEAAGDFEFSSAVNLSIADDSLTLTNTAADAQIDTKVIVNKLGRELSKFPSYGFNADRNGQYIDSIADLDTVTKAPGDTLNVPASYLVEGGAVVYNGAAQTAGSRFTTVSGQTTFMTSSGGVVREILEAPQRHTIMARFTEGGGTVTAGTALIIGYYYYVISGAPTYNGQAYAAGNVFKAVNTDPFSGTAQVQLAFSTESFQHSEPGKKPTSNNTGEARTGEIIRGNGDPAYLRGGLGIQEFPINAKFIQIRYIIKVNNLKP